MHNQQFSAHIIRAPLEQVLNTISSYGPIRFVIKGDVEHDHISSSFRRLSLQESLEKILVRYDFAIIHHQIDPAQKTSKFPYRTEVVILSRNHSESPSDSKNDFFFSPSRFPSPTNRGPARPRFEKPDPIRPLDLGTENNPNELLKTVEEVLQDTDTESLALVRELLEE